MHSQRKLPAYIQRIIISALIPALFVGNTAYASITDAAPITQHHAAHTASATQTASATPSKPLAVKKKVVKKKVVKKKPVRKPRKKAPAPNTTQPKTATQPPKSATNTAVVTAPDTFDEYQLPDFQNLPVTIPPQPPSPAALDIKTIPVDTYRDIRLNQAITNTWFQNEVYTVTGTTLINTNSVFAFLNYTDASGNDNSYRFSGALDTNRFTIPLYFANTGTMRLGVIPSDEGTSIVRDIQVIPLPPEQPAPQNSTITIQAPSDIELVYNGATDSVVTQWKSNGGNLFRVVFEQNGKTVTYVTRQTNEIPLRFMDFKGFIQGAITMRVDATSINFAKGSDQTLIWTSSAPVTAQIAYHGFRSVKTDLISLTTPIPYALSAPATVTIKGTTIKPLENTLQITAPAGTVDEIKIDPNRTTEETIPANTPFSVNWTPARTGRYILELNQDIGLAVINAPIYVGQIIPIIPDFQDFTKWYETAPYTLKHDSDATTIFNLINTIRTAHRLKPVIRNTALDTLAQGHTDDMKKRGFFGHNTPDGVTPEDRRQRQNYPRDVGENLASALTPTTGMLGLMRSPLHRVNILDPRWTRVGIGLTQKSTGELLIAQEFSADPFTPEAMKTLRTNLLQSYNTARADKNISLLAPDDTLTKVAQQWSETLAAQNEFATQTQKGDDLKTNIEQNVNGAYVQIYLFETNHDDKIADETISGAKLTDATTGTSIGIGAAATPTGIIKVTILLSKNP